MHLNKLARQRLLSAALVLGLMSPVAAEIPTLQLLAGLEKGQWEVRPRGGGPVSRVCLRSGDELLQLRHAGLADCSRFIVDDTAAKSTVQYACRGHGYGRTVIRRESASLVQVDSQGIFDGMPFDFRAEARKVGPCGS